MWILQLFIAFYIARFIGHQLVAGKYVTIAILLIIIPAFLYLSLGKKFFLLSISALIPFNFPESFYLPLNGWIEVIAPIVCLLMILEIFSKRYSFFSGHTWLFLFALAIIITWTLVNYIKNPVSGQLSFGASYEQRGLRNYFIIFVGITTFLSSYWFFRYRELEPRRWFRLLIGITLFLGYLRIIGYFKGFYLPFFQTSMQSIAIGSVGYYRATISGWLAIIGIFSLLCLTYGERWRPLHSVVLIAYLPLLLLSGGRAGMYGLIAGITAYILFVNRRFLIPFYLSIFIGIFIMISVDTFFFNFLHGQTERLASIKNVSPTSFSSRYYTTLFAFKIFRENPIFGKGIRHVELDEEDDKYLDALLKGEDKWTKIFLINHIKGQISMGGHGSYTSIIVIFGIGGIIFITTMVFGSIYHAYKLLKKNKEDEYIVSLLLFGFICMVMLSLFLIPSGNGYNVMILWYIAGMIAGLKARVEEKGLDAVKEEREEYSGERLLWAEE